MSKLAMTITYTWQNTNQTICSMQNYAQVKTLSPHPSPTFNTTTSSLMEFYTLLSFYASLQNVKIATHTYDKASSN